MCELSGNQPNDVTSFPSVARILGPINASVYGVAGLAIGLILWFAT